MKQATIPLYIRFGEIPKNEKSKVYRGDAILREEAGVSVYRAIKEGICYYPLMPDDPNENTISTYFNLLLYSDRKVFLVIGDELPIEGADREPLLTNIQIIKEITHYYRKSN